MKRRPAAAAAGVGLRQYRRGTSPGAERQVLMQAIIDACEDAGLDPAEIDGFVSYGDDQNDPVRLMPELGTRELRWSSLVWGGGGGGLAAAFGAAEAAIASEQASTVVVYRALVQNDSGRVSSAVMRHHLNDHLLRAGVVAPAQICALRARRLFDHHGVSPSLAQELVRVSYHHGVANAQGAGGGRELDAAAYQAARPIADPFRLFDCSRESDGAGAVLVVPADRAMHLRKQPVYLLGTAQGAQQGWGDLLENDADYASAGFKPIAEWLWQRTGLRPADIDVVQLYENFSAQGVASLIDHGFCGYDNAAEFIRFDNLIAQGGTLPVNTAGGNFADGFVHGIGLAVEAVRQLRGESCNPVAGARTCLLAGGPGAPTVSSAVFANAVP